MDENSTESILHDLSTLFRFGAAAGLTDGQLLDRFAAGGDAAQAAFEGIIRRHGPMVLGVCRRALGDVHAAEDAFQATFLVLAFRAHAITRRDSLAPWLHGVASRLARRARVLARKRQEMSRPLPELAALETTGETADLRPVLDEELGRLPEKYRCPLVLCYLEGLTQGEAARALGWTKGTVSGRLARAKHLLRGRLTRRGLAPAAGLLALDAGPGAEAAAMAMAVPPTMVGSTARAALALVLGLEEAGAVSAPVLALARGLRRAMLVGRLKGVTALLALGALAGAVALGRAGPDAPGQAPIEEAPVAGVVAVPEAGRSADPSLPRGARARMGSTPLRHEANVAQVVFSPDGRTLATGGWDRAVRLWDFKTGEPAPGLDVLKESASPHAMSFSHDGRLLAIGRDDGTVQLWDVKAKREQFRSKVHKGRVQGIAFAPDGLTFASASQEETCVRLWDVVGGKERLTLGIDGEGADRGSLAFSPDGSHLAFARSTTVRVWDVEAGGDPVVISKAHDCSVVGLAFADGGRMLITSGAAIMLIKDERGQIKDVETLPQIRLWRVGDGQKLRELDPEGVAGYGGFALSQDGTALVTSHRDRLLVWDLASGRVTRSIAVAVNRSSPHLSEIAFSPDGRTLAALRGGQKVHVLDFATGKPLFPESEAHADVVLSVAFAPDGHLLATSGADSTVRLWETANGRHRSRLDLGEQGWARSVCFSPDGKALAAVGDSSLAPVAGGFGGIARLWDLPDGRLRHELRIDHRATQVAFAPDGRRVAVAAWSSGMMPGGGDERGNVIHVFDSLDGRKVAELRGHTSKLQAIAFAPDGATVASAGSDMTFRLWDLADGREHTKLAITGHFHVDEPRVGEPTQITAAAFAPDLKAAVTSGLWDDRLIVWDLSTGRALQTIRVEKNLGSVLAVSPDGRRFASASVLPRTPDADNDIHLWEMATGRAVLRVSTGGRQIRSLSFSADGRSLASAMNDTTALVWDVSAAIKGQGRSTDERPGRR
jgi:RNA polymerase sigma factor (sigma-70 family)